MTMSGTFDDGRTVRIRNWMETQVASGRLAGLAVQVMHRGEVRFSEVHGMRDTEHALPVANDTIWRIFSMTKPIVSLAALMLYEEGYFQFDQPVSDFLPGFGSAGVWAGAGRSLDDRVPLKRPVTVHDLLTHQSGLVYADATGNALEQEYVLNGLDFNLPGDTLAAAVARLNSLPLLFQPGERWVYGWSTDVLGRLIEVVADKSLGAFLRERVFEPLNMVDTGFSLSCAQMDRLAACYGPGENGLVRIAPSNDLAFCAPVLFESGGSGLLSTMSDYQRFASMLLNGGVLDGTRLIGRKTFQLMVSNQIEGDLAMKGLRHFSETSFEGIGFGLGVSVMLDPVRAKILGSTGEFSWGGKASTAFWVDRAEEMTVSLMTQLIPSNRYNFRRELRVLCYQALT